MVFYQEGADRSIQNNLFYNNTFIDNDENIAVIDSGYSKNNWSGNEIKNNLVYVSGYCGSCVQVNSDAYSPNGVTYSHNLYNTDPCGTCNADDNAVIDDPEIDDSINFRDLTTGSVDGSEAALQEGSPAIDAGVTIASYDTAIASADFTASPPTVTTGDQDDYGPPGQATLQAEPDSEDLNPTLETNTYVGPTAGAQSWDIGAILASNDHLYTIWELDEDTVPGDDCTNGVDWVGGQTSRPPDETDLLSHTFTIEAEKTYCWRATFGNVAGDGTVSAVDQFTTTDNPGYIYMSEQFPYTSWTLWYTSGEGLGSPICDTGGEKCIYRFTDATFDDWLSPINVWNTVRSTDGGTTWARVQHPGQSTMGIWSEGSIQSSLADVSYYWNATNDPGDYIYFRCDYNTCGSGGPSLGIFEIPLRQYGINVGDNDYINIEDLTFRFGGATDDSTPENSMAIRVGDSIGITLNDITVEYSGYWVIGVLEPLDL
jgi:hypothetical protein